MYFYIFSSSLLLGCQSDAWSFDFTSGIDFWRRAVPGRHHIRLMRVASAIEENSDGHCRGWVTIGYKHKLGAIGDRESTNLGSWPMFVIYVLEHYMIFCTLMWCSGCMDRRIRGWVDAWEHFEMHHVLCCRPAIDSQIWMSWSQRICFSERFFASACVLHLAMLCLHSKTCFNTNPFWFQQSAADICHGESTMVAEVNINIWSNFAAVSPKLRLTFGGRASQPLCEVFGRWRSRRGKNPKLVPGSWRRCAWGMPPCPLMLQVDLWPRFSWAKDPIRSAGIPPSMTTWIQRWRRLGPWGIFYAWIDGGRHLKRKNAPWNPELPGWGRFSPDLLGLLPSEVEKADRTPKFFCSRRILSTTCKQRQQCWITQRWTPYHPLELVWSFRSTNLPSFSLPSLQDSSKVAGPPNHLKFIIFFPSYPSSNEWFFQFFILLFPPFSVQHVPNFYRQKLHTVRTAKFHKPSTLTGDLYFILWP